MKTAENKLDPAQSLQIITEAITKTKENLKAHGFLFLLWGWLIAIASISFFILQAYTTFKWFFSSFPDTSPGGHHPNRPELYPRKPADRNLCGVLSKKNVAGIGHQFYHRSRNERDRN